MKQNILLDSDTSFSFQCKMCGSCCKQMLIRLTPYDIIKLSSCLNMPTYDFISEYVVFLKTPNVPWLIAALKHVKRGECMFKIGKKCKVHRCRPLPCRLFPVGRKDDEFIFHRTAYCKGLNADNNFSLAEWLIDSEAGPFLEMSKEFYKFMEQVSSCYNFDSLDTKDRKMFYKLLYDYDSASLESTITLAEASDKMKFCLRMAEWFLEYSLLEKGIGNEDFLIAYEKHALLVENYFKS